MGGMFTPNGGKGSGSGLGAWIIVGLFMFLTALIIQHALGGPIP